MFLLDTNVISELRRAGTSKADVGVTTWASSVPPVHLFISAVTVLELEIGVLQIERRDEVQGQMLRHWLDQQVLPAFAGRVLPIDVTVAKQCAPLHVPNPKSERDAMIAATALVHGMTVVTRNTTDFESTGAQLLNPWGKH